MCIRDRKKGDTEIFSSSFLNLNLIWNDGIAFGLFSFDQKIYYNSLTIIIILVTLIICPFRSFSSSKIYQKLWDLSGGVSPLLKNTQELTNKLKLKQDKYDVYYAMRYQKPSIQQALDLIKQSNPSELIILPLFPHYASATSGSVFEEVTKKLSKEWVIPSFKFISQYYDHPSFILSLIHI